MATSTGACPECGTATSPGRYTCAACGAFLEGVQVAPRSWAPEPEPEPEAEAEPEPERQPEPARVAFDDTMSETAPVIADAAPPTWWAASRSVDALDASVDARDVEWPSFEDARSVLVESATSRAWSTAPEPSASAAAPGGSPAATPEPAPTAGAVPSLAPAPAYASALQPLPAPEPRVPAGAWLPPSALLTGLDEANASGSAAVAVPPAPRPSLPAAFAARDWLAALGTPERRWAAARQAIAVGAGLGVLGFLLPWANASPGSLLSVWTSVWGLVFPGSWLIVLAVAGFGLLATSSGRLAAIPLGVPSIALASMLLGLIWPTLIGASTRPIGILVVFVGAVVVGAGGIIHLGARHEAATPNV